MNKLTYNRDDYNSGDGMLTSVWGPSLWHYLHTVSFNYPVNPTQYHKKHYKELIINLQYTLPCNHCRTNIVNNLKKNPLTDSALKDRGSFSRWMFDLHEVINKMLCKKSNLTYELVRDRYENFRSRCTKNKKTKKRRIQKSKTLKKEKGCTVPTYGKRSRCIIKIVPQDSKKKQESFQMDKKCYKKK